MLIDPGQYCFIYKRASYEVYKSFRINKLELWLLYSISWYLQVNNRTVAGKEMIIETITGNPREKRKIEGYYQGLLRLKMIGTFEYISSPGSVSVGLSDLGVNTLRLYNEALIKFSEKYSKSSYRLDDFPPTITAEPLKKYKAIA